jgi:hypothetical protein
MPVACTPDNQEVAITTCNSTGFLTGPSPALGGLQIPTGLVVVGLAPTTLEFWVPFGCWACTNHPGVLGSIPKREEPGKTGRHPVLKYRVPQGSHRENKLTPCVEVQGSSRVPTPPWVVSRSPDGWDQIPQWTGGWVLHQSPWRFGFDSKREEPDIC